MGIRLILLIAALVFMILAALKVPESPRVSWYHSSLSCLIATLLV